MTSKQISHMCPKRTMWCQSPMFNSASKENHHAQHPKVIQLETKNKLLASAQLLTIIILISTLSTIINSYDLKNDLQLSSVRSSANTFVQNCPPGWEMANNNCNYCSLLRRADSQNVISSGWANLTKPRGCPRKSSLLAFEVFLWGCVMFRICSIIWEIFSKIIWRNFSRQTWPTLKDALNC